MLLLLMMMMMMMMRRASMPIVVDGEEPQRQLWKGAHVLSLFATHTHTQLRVAIASGSNPPTVHPAPGPKRPCNRPSRSWAIGRAMGHAICHMPYAICHMPWAMRGPWAPRLVVPRRLECREHGVERAPATIWIGLAERPSSGVQRIRIPFPHDDPPHTPFGRAWAIRGQRGTQTVHDCVRFARIR